MAIIVQGFMPYIIATIISSIATLMIHPPTAIKPLTHMLIEDLIHFDKTELTFNKLVYRFYKRNWKIKIWTALACVILLFMTFSISTPHLIYPWAGIIIFVTAVILVILTVLYSHKKAQMVIPENYFELLKNNEVWDFRTIQRIRQNKIKDYLAKESPVIDIQIVIEALTRQVSKPKYNFNTHNIILNFIGLVVGSYLVGLFGLFKDFGEMTKILAPPMGIVLLSGLIIFFFEVIAKESKGVLGSSQ